MPPRQNPQPPAGKKYKIEQKFIHGWDDAGWAEEINGVEKPLRFPNHAAAEKEIKDLITSVKEAVAAGDMESEYNPEDYRVMEAND